MLSVDRRELDRRAVEATGRIVAQVSVRDLDRPTPCGDWSLGELLGHMIGHHNGFALAAAGHPPGAEVWDAGSPGDDPHRAYQDAAARVLAAFAADDFLDRQVEVYGYGTFAAPVVLGMHFVDFLVHGWDVAKSIGAPDQLDPELSEAALEIALRWPYDRPDKAFGERVELPDDASASDRLVAYLGRSPDWQPPSD